MTKDRKDWLKDWSKVIFLISIVFACGKLYQKLDTLESNQVSARQENKEEHQSIKADLKECKDKLDSHIENQSSRLAAKP